MTAGLCTLELAVGREEGCPGYRCPFWDSADGAACVLGRIDDTLLAAPALARHLLELRTALVGVRRAYEEDAARRPLSAPTEPCP